MKISFYAPLKPISSQNPSGDRLIGRLFKKAWEQAGHQVEVASTFRSYEGKGNRERQARLRRIGLKAAEKVLRQLQKDPPDVWFTYHLYRKAPDWIGPLVCRSLNIPYVVAEASIAPSQSAGPWAEGYAAVEDALSQVDLVVGTTAADEICLLPQLPEKAQYLRLKPFLDIIPFKDAAERRPRARSEFSRSRSIPQHIPWLLTVAMMRPGVKFESYQVLAQALHQCAATPWHLLVAGHGPVFDDVKTLFAGLQQRITWLGEMTAPDIAALYAASDIYVWPSVRESPGMTFLEAQASGLPVVGGDGGGVADVIAHQVGGFLAKKRDAGEFAGYVERLLNAPGLRQSMGLAARSYVETNHSLEQAANRLNEGLSVILP
ncbi:MAG: glycosyltransferase family 4 protein [Rhodospirillales bacterium]|nr:glycosyltransferase family 4 protein [Rhodospirillales bacterium]